MIATTALRGYQPKALESGADEVYDWATMLEILPARCRPRSAERQPGTRNAGA